MYKHLPVEGGWIRVTCIFTARKCALDYLCRLNMFEQLRVDLVTYYQHATERHDVSFQDPSIFQHTPDQPSLHLPSFNKLKGYHSGPLTVLHQVREKFNMDLEGVLESCIPFTFASSYWNPYKVLKSWLDAGCLPNRTGTNNLTVEILHSMNQEYGGINKGASNTLRCSVFFNFSVTLLQIIEFCKNTRDVTLQLNQDETPRSFITASRLYQRVGLIGDLSAQHLIALLSGLGILRHGTYFLSEATVCTDTATFKKLKRHYHLPVASINQAYKYIASILGITTATVEQMVCEFLRDCNPSIGFSEASYAERINQRIQGILPLRPDVRFPNQWLFDVVNGKLQYEIFGGLQPVLVDHHVPQERLQDPYVLSRIQNVSMEIKVNKTSTF